MKSLLPVLLLLSTLSLSAQIVISEVMYNPPEGGTDSLEFVEIHNTGTSPYDLTDHVLAFGSSIDSLTGTIAPGGFYVSAVKESAFTTVYGVAPNSVWSPSGLSNGGTEIRVVLNQDTITSVRYDDSSPWPSSADGDGPSLELCDVNGNLYDGTNWQASSTSTGVTINGNEVKASPFSLPACTSNPGGGGPSYPLRSIAEMTSIDAVGQLDSIGKTAELIGVVNSPDFNGGNSIEFWMQDATGGIKVFSNSISYTVQVGDRISVKGTLEQRNGTAQFTPDSLSIVNQSNSVVASPATGIDESNQGELIVLSDFALVDPSAWNITGASFNAEIFNGTDTFTIRIDSDTDIAGMNEPTGTFDIAGIAWQFDSSSPFDEGYQLFPRSILDFSPYVPGAGPTYPLRTIDEMNNSDPVTGIPDSIGKDCSLMGSVIGFNLNNTGLLFSLQADTEGITVYSDSDDFGYTLSEGDIITVEGTITQFNGLTQIEIVSLVVTPAQPIVPAPQVTATLNESYESTLVRMENIRFPDTTQWRSDGSSFNIDFVTEQLDTFQVRVDDNSALAGSPAPDPAARYLLTGVCGQFDRTNPFLSGYQVFPRISLDIDQLSTLKKADVTELIEVLAEAEGFRVRSKVQLKELIVVDAVGRITHRISNNVPSETFLETNQVRNQINFIRVTSMDGRVAVKKIYR